jgi:hypothetical protein
MIIKCFIILKKRKLKLFVLYFHPGKYRQLTFNVFND